MRQIELFKRQKYRRALNEVGKKKYDFDFESEKRIYYYLCCMPMKKKELRKVDEKLQFNSYKEWKQYICNKYGDYKDEELMEFSRYINQRIRNIQPNREYWNLFVPIIMTIVLTEWFEAFIKGEFDFTGASDAVIIGAILMMVGMLVFSMIFLVWNTFTPLWEYSREENFLRDYKEIIDGMI